MSSVVSVRVWARSISGETNEYARRARGESGDRSTCGGDDQRCVEGGRTRAERIELRTMQMPKSADGAWRKWFA